MKTCSKCGHSEPAIKFYPFNRSSKCQDCLRQENLAYYYEKKKDPLWLNKMRLRWREQRERKVLREQQQKMGRATR